MVVIGEIMKKYMALCLAFSFWFASGVQVYEHGPHYYCTASDEHYFPMLMNLIGSIHKNDFNNLGEIGVWNLGLTAEQKTLLHGIHKVRVFEVEKKHKDILTHFKTSAQGRMVRGWFSWKPVVIKQALDIFPYVLYADAGTTILGDLSPVFSYIRQQGYFFIHVGHNIENRITNPVRAYVSAHYLPEQQQLLLAKDTMMIDAGLQGLSADALYDKYVRIVYEQASDLSLFMDDGSARLGFGAARHDQTLFSIRAHILGCQLFDHGWIPLVVDGKVVPIHVHWDASQVHESTLIYRSRRGINRALYEPHIRYKKS